MLSSHSVSGFANSGLALGGGASDEKDAPALDWQESLLRMQKQNAATFSKEQQQAKQEIMAKREEESKITRQPTVASTAMSQLQQAKASVRKLPMFETYDDDSDSFDFEWPTRTVLKNITKASALRVKEFRY